MLIEWLKSKEWKLQKKETWEEKKMAEKMSSLETPEQHFNRIEKVLEHSQNKKMGIIDKIGSMEYRYLMNL
jgi:hypothetical protein